MRKWIIRNKKKHAKRSEQENRLFMCVCSGVLQSFSNKCGFSLHVMMGTIQQKKTIVHFLVVFVGMCLYACGLLFDQLYPSCIVIMFRSDKKNTSYLYNICIVVQTVRFFCCFCGCNCSFGFMYDVVFMLSCCCAYLLRFTWFGGAVCICR